MSELKLRVKELGLTTQDGKGILPGSILAVKGEVIPAAWTGIVEKDSERKLEVATPGKDAEELKKLRAEAAELLKVADELRAENDAFKKQRAEDAEYALLEAQEKYKAVAGKDADKRWGIDTLREEIAKFTKV